MFVFGNFLQYGSSVVIRELNSWDENSGGESSSGFYSSLSLQKVNKLENV